MVTIAKDFSWEMGHRLLHHEGLCRNLHGHSYRLRLVLSGEMALETGMLIDYYEMEVLVNGVLSRYDHSFAIEEQDVLLRNFFVANGFRFVVLKKPPTAENLCHVLAAELDAVFQPYSNVTGLSVRVYETDGVYAEAALTTN